MVAGLQGLADMSIQGFFVARRLSESLIIDFQRQFEMKPALWSEKAKIDCNADQRKRVSDLASLSMQRIHIEFWEQAK